MDEKTEYTKHLGFKLTENTTYYKLDSKNT